MSKERIFETTFIIPARRRPKAKRNLTKRKKTTPKGAPQPGAPGARVEPTPEQVEASMERRREYERRRHQTPERKEKARQHATAKRNEAKALGLCVSCPNPTTPDQTRCETCAARHRLSRRKWQTEQRERNRQAATQ